VDFTVSAPDNTQFTPNSPLSNQLVRYGERPGYRYYQIAFPPLDPGTGLTIGPLQLGTWRMRVRGTALAGASERCTTSVLVESQVELRGIVRAIDTTTPIQVEALILDRGEVVTDAEVMVTMTAPQTSLGAASTPTIVSQALDADDHPIPAGLPALILVNQSRHALSIRNDQGVYSLELPPPEVDGVYDFEFQAKGNACGGAFDRYRAFSVYIGKRPSDQATTVDVKHASHTAAIVHLSPRDESGTLLGPGLSGLIKATLEDGVVHPVIDLRDGSYGIRASWKARQTPPVLKLTVGSSMAVRVPLKP